MKIIERSLTDRAIENAEYNDCYQIVINGKVKLEANDYGEPEDNKLSRDLDFVYSIVDLMKEAYEAGKKGEKFEITQEKVDKIE